MESYWCQSLGATHPDVPMDPLLLCDDDPTQPPLDSVGLFHPTDDAYPACERGAQVLSDISDLLTEADSCTESFSVPKHQSSTDSDCCDIYNTEKRDFVVYSYFSSSDPVSPLLDKPPQLSQDLASLLPENLSLPSQTFSDFYTECDSPLAYTAQTFGPESLTERPVFEPMTRHWGSCEQNPFRSLSYQSNTTAEVVTATEPLSELFIIESEAQEFIVSSHNPALDPREITCPDCLSPSQMQDADPDRDPHVLTCDSAEVVTQSFHRLIGDVDYESALGPPAADAYEGALMSGNDVSGGKGESSDIISLRRQSESPDELWLDACQYLVEEDAGNVFCKTGRFVTEGGDSSSSSSSSKVFGYSTNHVDVIGRPSGDTEGWAPPVERWSSVDSWESAISDWAGIIAVPPEDFTAAFTEIGAEIDALTQALVEAETRADTQTEKLAEILSKREDQERTEVPSLMLIQDQLLQKGTVGSSFYSGQKFLLESTTQTEISTPPLPEEEEPGEIQSSHAARAPSPACQGPSPGSTCVTAASPGEVNPESRSSSVLEEKATYLHQLAMEKDIYISHEDEMVVLNITEDTDYERQNVAAGLIIEEAFGDGVCKVTEEPSVSDPGLVAKQEHIGSGGSHLSVPGFSSSEAETQSCCEVTGEIEQPQVLHFSDTCTLKDSHVPGEDPQPGLNTCASPDTALDLDRVCQVEPQQRSPQFIMPIAPLSIGSSLVCGTSNTLGEDHSCAKRFLNDNRDLSRDYEQPQAVWPTSDWINTSSLEDKKENTPDSVEKSTNEQTVHLDDGLFISDFYVGDRVSASQEISKEFSDLLIVPVQHFFISQKDHVARITLDLHDPLVPRAIKPLPKRSDQTTEQKTVAQMPHKSHNSTSEGNKTRSRKEKSAGHHHGAQLSKKQENSCPHVSAEPACKVQETRPLKGEIIQDVLAGREDKDTKLVLTETVVMEKVSTKPHGKKKKKLNQNIAAVKIGTEPLTEVENGAIPKTAKGRIDMFETKLGTKAGKAQKESDQTECAKQKPQQPKEKNLQGEQALHHGEHKDQKPGNLTTPPNDELIKRRRLSTDKLGKLVGILESKLAKPEVSIQVKGEKPQLDVGATRRKVYSEVVKQKPIPPKEEPKVVQPIQVTSVSGDPQSLCLWCQFAAVLTDYTVTWSRDSTVLAEIKRSAGDESRVSLTVSNASHKDLGKYECRLSSLHGAVTLDYLLTYEVLSEIVIPVSPTTTISPVPAAVECEEEDVSCSGLMFREDFLSDQYFGDNHSVCIVTEKVHFGEGMHRRAFRTKLQTGLMALSLPGHFCVLKVHNSISYGTNNNEELVQKNFRLAVEECQVQNTAREYIKAYTSVAQTVEAFGEVPEIIPIYLVHRPSNDIPYATLEEELIGDFVKYSVKDGKEINLLRRDSEAGQKCCAFQHWVYQKTEGNLLVTDMQGVGMRLTDVGIATCKKGYKGFKGNCATSFIDQFKALHQCNKYCEILGLISLQPKPKKPASTPKAKPQPATAPKKKIFGPTLKSKS